MLNKDVVFVLGGDGFCGWPTALNLAATGRDVIIFDNLSRRHIDSNLSSAPLLEIASIKSRVHVANKKIGKITFHHLDLSSKYNEFKVHLRHYKPSSIIHFAEQRSAPYSMIDDIARDYTVTNNVSATHNILNAIVEVDKDIRLIHLGTMGVYGYSKEFGKIPEGYLDITVNSTGKKTDILYPTNPGSVYHMTKSLDQIMFQFYNKNWGLKITDLHQGIVWGYQTTETSKDPVLANRFDYDGIYGTVLNRFIVQAIKGLPISVYGVGGQSRAFININDTVKCCTLAIDDPDDSNDKVKIFNQVSEVHSVKGLAEMVADKFGAKIEHIKNPRKELAENDLEVSNDGLMKLGHQPILLDDSLVDDIGRLVARGEIDPDNVNNSPDW